MKNGANLEFTDPKSLDAAAAGMAYSVEWSDTMAPGDWHADGVTEGSLGDDDLRVDDLS